MFDCHGIQEEKREELESVETQLGLKSRELIRLSDDIDRQQIQFRELQRYTDSAVDLKRGLFNCVFISKLQSNEQEYNIRERKLRAAVAVVQTDLDALQAQHETRKQELQVRLRDHILIGLFVADWLLQAVTDLIAKKVKEQSSIESILKYIVAISRTIGLTRPNDVTEVVRVCFLEEVMC